MWNNITYFLKAVIPVAEESGVRMALHPNDPPAPLSRGSGQIMGTVAGWKKLIGIVESPSNGITFDCGVTREMGENPVEVCRYFASRDRINHVHFRNVRVTKPYEKYTEVFIDEGQVDMFAVMKELVRNKYTRTDLSRASARHRLRSRAPRDSAPAIPAAAHTRLSPSTWASPRRCSRPRSNRCKRQIEIRPLSRDCKGAVCPRTTTVTAG